MLNLAKQFLVVGGAHAAMLFTLSLSLAACPKDSPASSTDAGSDAKAGSKAEAGASGSSEDETGGVGGSADSESAGTGGSSETPEAGSGGGGTAGDSVKPVEHSSSTCTPLPDAGKDCNALENTATNVTISAVTGTLAVGTGGTIVDGRYYLTEVKTYPGSSLPSGIVIRQTIDICNGTLQLSENIADVASSTHKTSMFKPEGTAPNLSMLCSTKAGDSATNFTSYTATAKTITLYEAAGKFYMTMTKQ